jgi:hypothetical protein
MSPNKRRRALASTTPSPAKCDEHPGGVVRMSTIHVEVDDRFAQALMAALCEQLGLTVTQGRERAKFSIRGESSQVDALIARQDRLLAMLDDQLMTVAQNFIREHTGLEIRRAR